MIANLIALKTFLTRARNLKLKQRIRGKLGHLSNIDAARLITACYNNSLKEVILAHLSSDCNTPQTAINTVKSQLNLDNVKDVNISVSLSSKPTSIFKV